MSSTSPISHKADQGREERHLTLVGMHVMGWTSDLMSKHATHSRGMEERHGTREHYEQGSVFGGGEGV